MRHELRPRRSRELSEREQGLVKMASVLAVSKNQHGPCDCASTTCVRYCSCYWKVVFRNYFGEAPTGNLDPRWDSLFALGFPVLRSVP